MKKVLGIIMVIGLLLGSGAFLYAVETNPFTQGFIEGYLLAVNPGDGQEQGPTAEIETYQGSRFKLTLHPDATYLIDQRPVRMKDFHVGMEVYGVIQGRQLMSLEAWSTANLGYITPGSKMRKGTIAMIDSEQITITMGNGSQVNYYLSPAAIIMRKGEIVTASSLYTGDKVRVYFDDIYTDMIGRMEVEGDSILVKDLYRARLGSVDRYSNAMQLQNVQAFHNGGWVDISPGMKVPYNDQLKVYYAGQVIKPHNIKNYRNQTIYMVIKNLMGKESIDRLVIKSGTESAFTDKITTVNWYTDSFELASNRNLSFNAGSIIIKNGRLQDQYILSPNDDAFIIADNRGSNRIANIIYINNVDINHSTLGQNYVYAGRVEQIVDDRLWLEDLFLLNQHEWEALDSEKELFYDEDTNILDLDNGRRLTTTELLAGDYAVDEDSERSKENNLKKWYAYVYTDGDRICAITLQKTMDSLLKQRVTSGRVVSIADDSLVGWALNLGDASDWSAHKQSWMPKSSPVRMGLLKSMILKDGHMIQPEDLKTGDRLYVVRDDFQARVVIVK
ncbi:MAG: hypothetical protein GXY16_01105 [Syntrophomonadaceae bacterium]|nr:hypothetical protein [Syntrophomonadaceae bacterium]